MACSKCRRTVLSLLLRDTLNLLPVQPLQASRRPLHISASRLSRPSATQREQVSSEPVEHDRSAYRLIRGTSDVVKPAHGEWGGLGIIDKKKPRHRDAQQAAPSTQTSGINRISMERGSRIGTPATGAPVRKRWIERVSESGYNRTAEGERVEWEPWRVQKEALKAKFGDKAWAPRKRLSPDAVEGIRALRAQYPDHFTTPVLAEQFKVSVEAVRRILKSKWQPSAEEEEDRKKRWDKRGETIWTELVEKGVHAPKRWREMGIGGGPRRQAQDREYQRKKEEQEERAAKGTTKDGSGNAWLRSFAERVM